MRAFKLLYNSFIWGLLGAILAFQNTWLEMRINIAIIIPIIMIISILLFTIIKKGKLLTFRFSTINLIVCTVISMIILGFKRAKIVPASILREGLNVTEVSFTIMNLILAVILIGGLGIIYFSSREKEL